MSARRIRQRCDRLVKDLDIPVPFDAHELCARIGAARRRPIQLHAAAMPAGQPCGLWISAGERDVIVYEKHTTRLHQEHIILHELGHLLGNHQSTEVMSPDASQLLLPHIDRAVVNRVLRRTRYRDVEEREAELIATLILERASRWKPTSEWVGPPEAEGIRHRLAGAYEHPTEG